MKKIYLLILLVLSSLLVMAQDKFYVYQKDGLVQSFLYNQVDSITCSLIDTAGITQTYYATQLVHLQDTTVIIPLSAIDSVSFRDPEVVYRKDVVVMSNDFMHYIVEVKDDTVLYVSSSIPDVLLPDEGTILFYTESTQLLPNGFAGRVTDKLQTEGRWQITTTSPSMFEVYERLIIAETFGSDDHNDLKAGFGSTINLPLKYDPVGLTGKLALTVNVPDKPIVNFDKTLKFFYLMFDCSINLSTTIQKELEKGLDESIPLGPQIRIPLPTPATGTALSLKIDPRAFVAINGKMDVNCSLNQQFRRRIGVAFEEGQWHPFCWPVAPDGKPLIEAKFILDGSASLGLQLGVGVGMTFGKDYTGLRGRIGPQLSANISFVAGNELDPSSFYSENKNAKIGTGVNWSISSVIPEYLADLLEKASMPSEWTLLNKDFVPDYAYLFPDFTEPKVISTNESGTDVQVTSTASRKTYLEPTIGLALYKDYKYFEYGGRQRYKGHDLLLGANFNHLEKNINYQTVPIIELFGMSFIGDQITEFTVKEEEKPESSPIPEDLIGTWILDEGSDIDKIIFALDAQGHFSFAYLEHELGGAVSDDSSWGNYIYNSQTKKIYITGVRFDQKNESAAFYISRLTKSELAMTDKFGEVAVFKKAYSEMAGLWKMSGTILNKNRNYLCYFDDYGTWTMSSVFYAIYTGYTRDFNENGIYDYKEGLVDTDLNRNGIPDLDEDLNYDGVIDGEELREGLFSILLRSSHYTSKEDGSIVIDDFGVIDKIADEMVLKTNNGESILLKRF